jgi:hypothetical protein
MGKLRGYVALGVAVLAVAVLAQTSPGRSVVRGLGLSKAPARYAQLSFTRPQALPTIVGAPHATVSEPFEIRNSGSGQQTYEWSVTLAESGVTQRLASGHTVLAAGRAATVTKAVRFGCRAGNQVRLTFSLASPRQSIDFSATCDSAAPGSS